MGQAQINVRIRACSRTSIARTKQAALTHNVRGKELTYCSYNCDDSSTKQNRLNALANSMQQWMANFICDCRSKTES